MPIGTRDTAIILKTTKTRISTTSKENQQNSFWWELFELLVVQVIAAVAAPLTGGWSEAFALGLGISDFVSSTIGFGIEVGTDFLINELNDYLTGQISGLNTALNILPGAAGLGKVTRGYRATKFLKLAKETELLDEFGVKNAKNIEQFISNVTGREILTNKIGKTTNLFNYVEKPNRETVLRDLGFLGQQKFKTNYKNLEKQELKNYLNLQYQLAKLSPHLTPKLKVQNLNRVDRFLKEFNTDFENVIRMNNHDWQELAHLINKSGRGEALLLTLQQIRANAVKFNYRDTIIHKAISNSNQLFKYFNPDYYFRKGLEKTWKSSYLKPLRERVIMIQEKIDNLEQKLWQKINDLGSKAKDALTPAEKKAISHAKAIPLHSSVFLMCKIQPLNFVECAITIFYHDERYKPFTVVDTLKKAETFVSQIHPFSWYRWQSGWYIGYGVTSNKWIKAIAFAPPAVQQIVKDSFKVYHEIFKIIRTYKKTKIFFNDPISKLDSSVKRASLKFSINNLLGVNVLKELEKTIYKGAVRKGQKKLRKTMIEIANKKISKMGRHKKSHFWKEF